MAKGNCYSATSSGSRSSTDHLERLLDDLAALVEDGEVFTHIPDVTGYQGLQLQTEIRQRLLCRLSADTSAFRQSRSLVGDGCISRHEGHFANNLVPIKNL